MSEIAIKCINLKKNFGKKRVLRDIRFTTEKGKILGLIGPNGTGKTTLMKILATLVTPSEGEASILGNDIVRNPENIRKLMGFVTSEERSFYWRLTGRQNLEFFATLHNINGKEKKQQVCTLLEAVGLGQKADMSFREYSTGMKQALGIARGMLHSPQVLLLDEPTRSLSPDIAKKIRMLIRDKASRKGTAILIASHNLREVEELADHIAIIHNGMIKAVGNMNELQKKLGFSEDTDLDKIFELMTGN